MKAILKMITQTQHIIVMDNVKKKSLMKETLIRRAAFFGFEWMEGIVETRNLE
jgi:hypothetical protein